MTKKTTRPMFDVEKQITPLAGETSPEEARIKARFFASQIKNRMKSQKVKSK
jgi:hypothetical protein